MTQPTQSPVAPAIPGDGPTLVRQLGPVDAAAIVVSNVIGGGIFFVPVIVAMMVPHGGAILFVWFLGGALAFAGAMAYAELAALRPRAGAEYVYLRGAFGPLAAFLTGWTSFVAGFSGAIAAGALALADYMGRFLPAASSDAALLAVPIPFLPLIVSPKALVALTAIAALSLIHIRGLGPGSFVQNILAAVKTLALVVFVALGFSLGTGDAGQVLAGESAPVSGMMLALIPIMFSYSGWNAAAYVAEEVRDPGRNVPLALGLGTVTVIIIYLALNALYLYAMPVQELASLGDVRLIDRSAERLFGFVAGDIIALFTIVSLAASISAMVLAGPRVYYAMARDGMFLPGAARVHSQFHTPVAAILAQGLWSGVLVLSGTLTQLVSYTGFAVVLFSGIAVSALFVLRHREPDAPRPFRAWGYPWAPGIFVVASAAMVVNEILRNGSTAIFGMVVIALGVPVYYLFRRSRKNP